jgi:hypothetical protein
MTNIDDLAEEYRRADRRLRGLLFGNGEYEPGMVKGEERRAMVTQDLRHMRTAFDAALAANERSRAEKAEARVADLEEELKKIASSRARRASGHRARASSRKASPHRVKKPRG